MDPLGALKSALADRYRVEREIGAGGMATVYLARDLKHDRNVALKLLSPELGAVLGAERFLSEIRVTANLQHPHLLPLFDSGEVNGLLFYVMPFVQGESLRARLDRERQLGIDEAVRIATAVASALDYAHRQGVIHRDLKPENILLHDGQPLVADFGIALAVSKAGGTRVTQTGLSLGTPQYMSPEQATGDRVIDGRTDIYSLGAVLYEMLTGEAPHTGATAQAIIARVITDKPRSMRDSRSTVPEWLDAAVERALAKLPADRWPTAQSFADVLQGRVGATSATSTFARHASTRAVSPKVALAAGVAAIVGVTAGWFAARGNTPEATLSRYAMDIPDSITPELSRGISISADGSVMGFIGRLGTIQSDTAHRIWVKRRDSHVFTAVPGVTRPRGFALSPDGLEIVYVQGTTAGPGLLFKVSLAGGTPKQLADSGRPGPVQVTWLDDNTIVYPALERQLRQIADTGGVERIIFQSDSTRATSPIALPGSRGVLFIECLRGICEETRLVALDIESGQTRRLLDDVVWAAYSHTGHIVFLQPNGVVQAIAFDARRMTVSGDAVPVDSAYALGQSSIRPLIAISSGGTLLTWRGVRVREDPDFQMYWYDRSGQSTPLDTAWTARLCCVVLGSASWSLSPDGRRLAVTLSQPNVISTFIKRLPDGPVSRLTLESRPSVWQTKARFTPDGRWVSYHVGGQVPPSWQRIAPTGGRSDSLFASPEGFDITGWSNDGNTMVGHMRRVDRGLDIVNATVGLDSAPRTLISTQADEREPALSPDGKWIAYVSDETGSRQVYVRPYPEVDRGRWTVSAGSSALLPVWSPDSREIFYVDDGRREFVAVPITTAPEFEVGAPRVLFRLPDDAHAQHYATVDGKRFLLARAAPGTAPPRPVLVMSEYWSRELRRRLERR